MSTLASAGALVCPTVWASPVGTRKPAPAAPPPTSAQADRLIAASVVPKDEPVALAALEEATKAGASYADARLVLYQSESISIRDRDVDEVRREDEYGLAVRVIADGGWGFAATPRVDIGSARAVARRAVETAKRNGKMLSVLGRAPVTLAPAAVARGSWVAPHEVDPLSISVGDKAMVFRDAARKLLETPGVQHARAGVEVVVEDKLFVSTEGARVHQIVPRLSPSLTATAIDRRRGTFTTRGHEAPGIQGGWEYVLGLELERAAPEIAAEARMKLYAASVAPGPRQVILAPSNLWLTIHESIGHPTELDRAMGLEADFAGTSFIKPDDAGKLQIGNERVTFMADRTQPGGLATVSWDDDGVVPSRWPIIERGTFVGWQTTRDQAAWIGESASRGCSYGQGYKGVAFQRMPNVSLQPGPEGYTTEDLVNATEKGILITGRGSWSIDHQRHNFQFSGQMFWEIEKGRLTRPLRDVAYQANTIEFWKSCDMLGGEGTYRLGGTFGDGKGQPSQSNAVSHGCPPARFSVNIVNTGGGK